MASAQGGSYVHHSGYPNGQKPTLLNAASELSLEYNEKHPSPRYGDEEQSQGPFEAGVIPDYTQRQPHHTSSSNKYGTLAINDSGVGHRGRWDRYDQGSNRHEDHYIQRGEPRITDNAWPTHRNIQRHPTGQSHAQGCQTFVASRQPRNVAFDQPRHQAPNMSTPQRSFSDGQQQGPTEEASSTKLASVQVHHNRRYQDQGGQIPFIQKPRSQPSAHDRIFHEPSSPRTISWDNPFPTFPNLQEKRDGFGEGENDRQHPQNPGNGQSYGPARSKKPRQPKEVSILVDHGESRFENASPELRASSSPIHHGSGGEWVTPMYQQPQSGSDLEINRQDSIALSGSLQKLYQSRSPIAAISLSNGSLDEGKFTFSGTTSNSTKGLVSAVEAETSSYALAGKPAKTIGFQGVSSPLETSHNYEKHMLQPAPWGASQSLSEGYGGILDSYHDGTEGNPSAVPMSEDMPNFDAVADGGFRSGQPNALDKQLHLGSEKTPTASYQDDLSRGRNVWRSPSSYNIGMAHRSRSQPNFRRPEQNRPNQTPPMPLPKSQQHHAHNHYNDQQLPHESYQNRQLNRAAMHSDTSVSHGHAYLQMTAHRLGYGDSGYQSTEAPNAIMRRPSSERTTIGESASTGYTRYISPKPDILPEFPVLVRPGFVQQSQVPKPPPVRQYNFDSLPRSNNVPAHSTSVVSTTIDSSGSVIHQELQRLQQAVQISPHNQQAQILLAKKLVEAASALADDDSRADNKTRNKNREKFVLDAHKIVKKLASSGNTEAIFYLADCHGRGLLGLQPDPKEAFNLYQSAAKLGHAPSAYRVAVCCEMGQDEGGGTRRDPLKAIQWYKRAATLGDTPAMYKMGMIQLKGLLGQPRNFHEATVWLKRAAERADSENPHALHELGLLYENASGNDNVIRDEEYAKQLFLQAADLNYKFSQYRLGAAFEYGSLSCPIDPRQSIAWYSRAASQEEHQSELALSGWYLTGTDGILQQSDTEAYLWARKAAQAGLAKAEYAMGYFTEVGIGAPADLEAAKRWYWRAASQNFPKARERLEDLRKGGARMQKSRVSRSAVNTSEGDCILM